ncbi:MAG: LPS biosynthesis glycosyltransferase [Okeania sp. SIO3I5]|uniref:LPS biosynthesis glycosyltransferase n=1 Tax=Okeania sp. SIO3I5 TaxID=2607805 RepID=UPI0013B66E52|nr:LPS biosynthesis glycosyltransferase [Okeania sp. SIO3I5]NEQ34960.1 LPS biosynthesis glycosyltransferase [Okeania sp. SIO3I5]
MSNKNSLIESISSVFIIAYKEDTTILEKILQEKGFNYELMRQKHQPEYKSYSPSYLTLLNHKNAWIKASEQEKPSLIIEADFVPVINFGSLPLPFNLENHNVGIAWLYTCAPQIYTVSDENYAQGFSTSAVAYILTPGAALQLIELENEVRLNSGTDNYSTWDSTIDEFLRSRNFQNFVPFRNYGEHGGLPNLEHSRFGLSKVHRADILYDKLAFMPIYAGVDKFQIWRLFGERFQARLKGILRLLVGKYLRLAIVRNSSFPLRLIRFAILRQLSLRI